MSPKTDAQKKAQKKYMENVATIQIRTNETHRDEIKAHSKARNESVNTFILRAIDQAIKQDNEKAED